MPPDLFAIRIMLASTAFRNREYRQCISLFRSYREVVMGPKQVLFWHGTRGMAMWYAMRVFPLLALFILIGGLAVHLAYRPSTNTPPLAASVIDVGQGNAILHALGVTMYSTAPHGMVLLSNGGKKVIVRGTHKSDSTAGGRERYYIGNKKTKVFHRPSCAYLPAKKNRVYFQTRKAAIRAGYRPCKRCKP